jgi:putative ABC transport system ATP-binding protein
MDAIIIENLSKELGNEVILKNVSLAVQKKEKVLITGRSGAGKTTLFNIIGCLEKPTGGKVLVLGRDTAELTRNEMSKLRLTEIGFIFQDFNLLPHLTAYENIELVMELAGRKSSKRKISRLLNEVGLRDKQGSFPTKMSGGEIRRLTIARALANKPKIVLADEPTSNLDEKNSKKIMKLLCSLNRKYNTSIVVISHDPVVKQYFKKKFLLKNKKLRKIR